MVWLVITLLLVFPKLDRVASTDEYQPLLPHESWPFPRELAHPNQSSISNESESERGLKPPLRIQRVALTRNESLTRGFDPPLPRIYHGDPASIGHIPFIVSIYWCGGHVLILSACFWPFYLKVHDDNRHAPC